jgi:hypothetical protein
MSEGQMILREVVLMLLVSSSLMAAALAAIIIHTLPWPAFWLLAMSLPLWLSGCKVWRDLTFDGA